MKTVSDVLKLSTQFLTDRKIDRSRRISEELLSHILQLKRLDLYLQFDKPLLEEELTLLRSSLKRAAHGEPLPYILGSMEFFHCTLKVDPRALIPRPETEILVSQIALKAKTGALWDLCTGSGCIGIALKKASPNLQVTLSDLSPEALSLARENAALNQVDVSLLQGDLLAPFQGQKADWIICNPPYISSAEYAALDPSVRDFEPKMALLGGPQGFEFYERLARELPSHLNPGAQVFFEIGHNQAEILKKIFPQATILPDWSGYPRFLHYINKSLI